MAAINILTRTNADQTFAKIRSGLSGVTRALRTESEKIEEGYIGSDFSRAVTGRLQHIAKEVQESQQRAMKQLSSGNAEGARRTIDKSALRSQKQLTDAVREEVKHVARLNASYRVQERILEKGLKFREKALKSAHEIAKLDIENKYDGAIYDANKAGKPTAGLIAQKGTALKEQDKTFEDLVSALKDNTDSAKSQLREERKNVRESRRQSMLERKGRGALGAAGSIPGKMARGALAGAGLLGITSIVGIVTQVLSEGMKLDQAQSKTAGLRAGISGAGGTRFGKSTSEMLEYGAGVARTAGRANYDVEGQLAFERGFGMDEGGLRGLTSMVRLSERNDSAKNIALEAVGTFRNAGIFGMDRRDGRSNYTQLPEKLNMITQLLSQQTEYTKSIDERSAIGITAAFGKAGFEDPKKIMQLSSSISDSIKNPQGEFQQALNYASIARANPNSNWADLKRQQEKGIFGEGNFMANMISLKAMSGGNADRYAINTSDRFGISMADADEIVKMAESGDWQAAQKMAAEASMSGEEKRTKLMEDAYGQDGYIQQLHAEIKSGMANFGVQAIDVIASAVERIKEVMSSEDPMAEMAKAFQDGVDWTKVGAQMAAGAVKGATKDTSLEYVSNRIETAQWEAATDGKFKSIFDILPSTQVETQREGFKKDMLEGVEAGERQYDRNRDGVVSEDEKQYYRDKAKNNDTLLFLAQELKEMNQIRRAEMANYNPDSPYLGSFPIGRKRLNN